MGSYGAPLSAQCTNCSAGRADSDSRPTTPCAACTAGQFNTQLRQLNCADCPKGEWSDMGGTSCYPDPDPFRNYSVLDFAVTFAVVPLLVRNSALL